MALNHRLVGLERSAPPPEMCACCGRERTCEQCQRWNYCRVDPGSIEYQVFIAVAARVGLEWPKTKCSTCGHYWLGIDGFRTLLKATTADELRALVE